MTTVISAYIKKKKLIEIGEFLCSHFKIEVSGEKQHFWHIMFYYFKKSKNPTQKTCAAYGEGAVTDPKHVKSGL